MWTRLVKGFCGQARSNLRFSCAPHQWYAALRVKRPGNVDRWTYFVNKYFVFSAVGKGKHDHLHPLYYFIFIHIVSLYPKKFHGEKEKGYWKVWPRSRLYFKTLIGFFPVFLLIFFHLLKVPNRELKERWRQKSKSCRLAKEQLCTCITLFGTFLCRHCTTATWKYLNSRVVEDVNTRQRLSWLFFSRT